MAGTGGCALFIDHENVTVSLRDQRREVTPARLASVFKVWAETHGRLIVAESFANWTRFTGQADYDRFGITPVFAGEAKNAADIRMATRAYEANENPAVKTIILVTGDRDLKAVAQKIRQTGRVVVVWAVSSTAAGQLKGVADEFETVEDLLLDADRKGGRPPGGGPRPAAEEGVAATGGHGTAKAPGQDKRRFSVSELKAYEQCPRRWYLQYIRNVRTPPTHEGFVGQHIHHALRDLMLKPPEERTLEFLCERLRTHWRDDRRGRECFQKDREFERKCGERAIGLLENFYLGADLKAQPKQVELFLDWTVAPRGSSGTPGGLPAGVTLTGKIDRIDGAPDGRLIIIDYKTGRLQPSDEYLRQDIQVAVYWTMVEETQKTPVGAFKFLGLAEYRELEMRPSPDDLGAALGRVTQIIGRIHTDPDPQPKVGPLCPWCGHLDGCPDKDKASSFKKAPEGSDDLPF